jgi:hypothetical protein
MLFSRRPICYILHVQSSHQLENVYASEECVAEVAALTMRDERALWFSSLSGYFLSYAFVFCVFH